MILIYLTDVPRNPMTFYKLLTDLPKYGHRGNWPDLDLNSQQQHWPEALGLKNCAEMSDVRG